VGFTQDLLGAKEHNSWKDEVNKGWLPLEMGILQPEEADSRENLEATRNLPKIRNRNRFLKSCRKMAP